MDIIDLRDKSKEYRARDALQRALPLIPEYMTQGIRNIVMLDEDCHGNQRSAARCVNVKGANECDIELYFKHYENIPKEISGNHVFLGLLAVKTLFHELCHQVNRSRNEKKQIPYDVDQQRPGNWAEKYVMEIMMQIYPFEEYREEYDQIQAMGKKVAYLLEV